MPAAKSSQFRIEVKADAQPFCARIILIGKWKDDPEVARDCLKAVVKAWPRGVTTQYLITCGGFISFPFPAALIDTTLADDNSTYDDCLDWLRKGADEVVDKVLTREVLRALSTRTKFVTIGVDALRYVSDDHAELVAITDVGKNKRFYTGKTYPTPVQEASLFSFLVWSHFRRMNRKSVCILGCHDLNLFSHRSQALANRASRMTDKKEAIRDFAEAVRQNKPTVVLQHPHTTDTERIWNTAISGMLTDYPHIEHFASAGRFCYRFGKPRSTLDRVLSATKRGPTLDFVVRLTRGSTP